MLITTKTKETESSCQKNDDHNDNTSLYNSTRSSTNDIKLQSLPLIVKPNHLIKFKDLNNIEYKGKVLNCAGKATDTHKLGYNNEYHSPSTSNGTKIWIGINNVTESDNQRETMETALNNNKTKETYENSHLCFEQAKLKELKSWVDMFIRQ